MHSKYSYERMSISIQLEQSEVCTYFFSGCAQVAQDVHKL